MKGIIINTRTALRAPHPAPRVSASECGSPSRSRRRTAGASPGPSTGSAGGISRRARQRPVNLDKLLLRIRPFFQNFIFIFKLDSYDGISVSSFIILSVRVLHVQCMSVYISVNILYIA